LNILSGAQATSQTANVAGIVNVDGNASLWSVDSDINLVSGNAVVTVSSGGTVHPNGIVLVDSLATLKGDGTVSGSVVNRATVAPGVGVGTLHIDGAYVQSGTGKLQIELGGTTPGTNYDQLSVTSVASLAGMLNVSLVDGFSPAVGNTFNILDALTFNGIFSTITLPPLAAGRLWNTSQLYTTGVLSVVPAIPGDYNVNGVVDAADYIVWRKNQGSTHVLPNDPTGGTIGAAQFDQWRVHFGQTAASGSGAVANAAVPEPATLVLLIFAATGWCLRRSRAV
jgi:hypothetical protein